MEQILEPVKLKRRSDLHLARKIWHMTTVSMIAALYAYLPEKVSLILLTISWFIFVPFDFYRLRNPQVNEAVLPLLRPIMRQAEVQSLAGTTYLLTGIYLVALIFPPPIVFLTMLFLAFADPIASYFGIRFGKDKIFGEKSLQGSFAAFFVCAILTFAFLNYHDILLDRVVVVSLLGGLIGALAELLPIGKLDDNLTLPLLSAVALWLVFSIFGVFAT